MTGRKEMFYLTMHSTHFIYGYMTLEHMMEKIIYALTVQATLNVMIQEEPFL